MKYTVKFTSRFKKDFKKAEKQKKDIKKLKAVIAALSNGEKLDDTYKDHELKGIFKGKRECHIEPDWLLIYEYEDNELILYLIRTGSHSDLLDM